MICRNCNREYDDEYRFCPFCGTEKEWFWCPKCSFSDPTYSFCPRCGEKLIRYEDYEEKLIEIVRDKYYFSINIQEYVIKQIKRGLIMFISQIDDWFYFKEFKPISRSDMSVYIRNCIPDEFEFTEEMKDELIWELPDSEILSIEELNEKIMQKKEEKEKKEKEEKEKWKWDFIKESEEAYKGTKMAEMRKYNKELYG